jgi:hypothetical protein
MVSPQAEDRANNLQLKQVAENKLNKQPQTTENRWPSRWEFEYRDKNSLP